MHAQGSSNVEEGHQDILTLDHKAIREEATKRDRLEYEESNVHKSNEDSEESEESDSKSKK